MINIAVCDDNKDFSEMLCRLIDDIMTESKIPHKIANYFSGSKLIEQHKISAFDAVFLNVAMPETEGFITAKEVFGISDKTYIIIVTAENGLVYDGSDFTPFRFLSKSNCEIFKMKLFYVIQSLSAHLEADEPIFLETSGGVKRSAAPSQIVLITSGLTHVYYTLSSGEVLRVRGKLNELQMRLPSNLFARVNRSSLVNMAYISQISIPKYRVILQGERYIELSERYKDSIEDKYIQYLKYYN
ncbi:MAG: LytTR family transcriptional regulator DNA-binding domain-containing protein [Oscillospiraceae bacterium]|nr:LytTR family transcriptional regulator DNA-binding domain-containing protein [Oscillospiraceae bacterium]